MHIHMEDNSINNKDTDTDTDTLISSLRSRIKELELENAQLKSQLSHCSCTQVEEKINGAAVNGTNNLPLVTVKKSKKSKYLEIAARMFKHFSKRYVALKVMYFGQRYYGFSAEGQMEPTIESELFKAFEKTRLLLGDWKESQYSRCGRTDKGVSAAGQVIALYLRSNLKDDTTSAGVKTEGQCEREINYVKELNKVLPKDIRIIGWSPVPVEFHARILAQNIGPVPMKLKELSPSFNFRFSCKGREYKYFFWRDNLDISAMQDASKKLLGEHDFRNFCKMDAVKVHIYKRSITSFDIIPITGRCSGKELWAFKVSGTAFLWHQVRCMVAILFMIGRGLESAEIIDTLLDIERTPKKPQYTMAPEMPLVLHSCEFEDLRFTSSADSRNSLTANMENEYENLMLQAVIFREGLGSYSFQGDDEVTNSCRNGEAMKKCLHVPLMARPTEPSYEERRAKFKSGNQEEVEVK